MFFKLVLKGFKLKKLVVEPKNGSTGWIGRGSGRPTAQQVEARVDPQLNRSRVQENFLFLPERLFNRSRLNLNRLRSGRGPTVAYQALNAND